MADRMIRLDVGAPAFLDADALDPSEVEKLAVSTFGDLLDGYAEDGPVTPDPDLGSLPRADVGGSGGGDSAADPALSLGLTLDPGASSTPIADGCLLYANAGPDTDVIVRPSPGGAAEWYVLVRGKRARTRFPVNVALGHGERLVRDGDDTVAVLGSDDAVEVALSAGPGIDAAGRSVSYRFRLEGDLVVLELDHAQEGTSYPVMVASYSSSSSSGVCYEEARWCAVPTRYRLCNRARRHSDAASREAARQFPGTLHNGRGDAFRHCYWNARMAINFGRDTAREFADRHEACRDDDAEKRMDLLNNEIGRGVGTGVRNEEDSYRLARDRCLELTNTGQLWVIGPDGKEAKG